jgi:hypothetical protein
MDRNFISKLLFLNINIQSKAQRFKDITVIQLELLVVLDSITKWDIHRCIQQWKKCWT